MRAVVGCAILSMLLVGSVRAGATPPKLRQPASCEEQCQLEKARDEAACDERPLREGDRALCHVSVQARLEVCLRICED